MWPWLMQLYDTENRWLLGVWDPFHNNLGNSEVSIRLYCQHLTTVSVLHANLQLIWHVRRQYWWTSWSHLFNSPTDCILCTIKVYCNILYYLIDTSYRKTNFLVLYSRIDLILSYLSVLNKDSKIKRWLNGCHSVVQ